MNLEFIEDGHRYLFNGEEVPSVSEILRFAAREVYKTADKTPLDIAADRGKRVHKACEELDRTGECECDGDIEGYVAAYAKFLKEHAVSWDKIESPFYEDQYCLLPYAGTMDRHGTIDNIEVLVDIKTTKTISGKHKLLYTSQLDAYSKSIGHPWMVWYILQLKEDGTYKLIKIDKSKSLFTECLFMHYQFEKTKRRKKGGRGEEGCGDSSSGSESGD